MTKTQIIQDALNLTPDDIWGRDTDAAVAAEKQASLSRHRVAPPYSGLGDGTWPWNARVIGDDVEVRNARMTCFGGGNDPKDSGETASGISTKRNPDLAACSLPMDGRMFANLSKAEHAALDGSPIPRVPWRTLVRVTVGDKTVNLPVIDLGPGKRTGNALDLTIAAARLFDPKASATNFEARGDYRILGGAKFVKTVT